MDSINPFNDPEFKQEILKKEGVQDPEEAEIIDNDSSNDLKSLISSGATMPMTGNDKKFSNIILDASALAKKEKDERAVQISSSLNNIFTEYNKKYDLDLQIDFDSMSRTLVNVSDDKSRRVLELYLSKSFRSLKSIMILHLIQRLTLAIDYITDPGRMLDQNSLTTADMFLVVEKLLSYIDTLDDLKKDIVIDGDDLELSKIATENTGVNLSTPESKKVIEDFMNIYIKDHNEKK